MDMVDIFFGLPSYTFSFYIFVEEILKRVEQNENGIVVVVVAVHITYSRLHSLV
jgi:hypothetical protein